MASITGIEAPDTVQPGATREVTVNLRTHWGETPEQIGNGCTSGVGFLVVLYVAGEKVDDQFECVPSHMTDYGYGSETFAVTFPETAGTADVRAEAYGFIRRNKFDEDMTSVEIEDPSPPEPNEGEYELSVSVPETAQRGDTVTINAEACCAGEHACPAVEYALQVGDSVVNSGNLAVEAQQCVSDPLTTDVTMTEAGVYDVILSAGSKEVSRTIEVTESSDDGDDDDDDTPRPPDPPAEEGGLAIAALALAAGVYVTGDDSTDRRGAPTSPSVSLSERDTDDEDDEQE